MDSKVSISADKIYQIKDSLYPINKGEPKDIADFENELGLKYTNSYVEKRDRYYSYDIIDERVFFLARITYGI